MSDNPSYAPANETSTDLWTERSELIGDTVLCSFTLGIMFTLYVLCLTIFIPQLFHTNVNLKSKGAIWFQLSYSTGLFILIGIGAASNFRSAQTYWIDDRDFPGGPLAFIGSQTSLAAVLWGWTTYVLASWLQDGYLLYRFLVFWEFNYWLAIFPGLIFFAAVSASIVTLVEINIPGLGLSSPLGTDFVTVWYVLSVSLNAIITLAIVARLLWKRREITQVLGKQHTKMYTGVSAMLIESSALYSIVGLVYVGTFFRQDPTSNLVLPLLGNLEGICPMLIIYRVASGHGWTRSTMHQVSQSISGIQFATPQDTSHSRSRVTNLSTVTGLADFDTSDGSTKAAGDVSNPSLLPGNEKESRVKKAVEIEA